MPSSATTGSAVRRVRTGIISVAIAAGAVIGTSPGTAVAEPTPSAVVPPNSLSMMSIPFDAELAAAVRMLRAAGVDQMALQAAQAIIGSAGQLSTTDLIGRAGALPLTAAEPRPVAETDPSALFEALGIQTLTPSVAPFCTDPTPDNPLGLVTAGAGAVAGPWPLKQDPLTELGPLLSMIPGVSVPSTLNLVESGETAYAFVPGSPAAGGEGTMQVAWFNTTTLQGGFADLEPVTDQATLTVLPILSGVRLVPVDTGKGTILSAVYGTARNGDRTCMFLPAVGVVNA